MTAAPEPLPAPRAAALAPGEAAQRLRDWLRPHRRVFVLTGAGLSAGSGIAHYRDEHGAWQRKPPIDLRAFTGDARARSRYWARSFVGWPSFAQAEPNAGHRALAQWQQRAPATALVTQNVDGLHARAGSREVVDLHGRLDEVVCLGCGARRPRAQLQEELAQGNPDWQGLEAAALPDGDADLEGLAFERFQVPDCAACGGMLKPDVVFFGENVPRARVAAAQQALAQADAMLVIGSSLMVYSGFRFARAAREAGLPLALLNRGVTRADPIATLKLEADCAATLHAALG